MCQPIRYATLHFIDQRDAASLCFLEIARKSPVNRSPIRYNVSMTLSALISRPTPSWYVQLSHILQGDIRILEKKKQGWINNITLQPSCGTLIMAFLDLDFELNSCPLAPSNLTAFLKLREFSSYQATEFLHLNVNICWAWLLSSCR